MATVYIMFQIGNVKSPIHRSHHFTGVTTRNLRRVCILSQNIASRNRLSRFWSLNVIFHECPCISLKGFPDSLTLLIYSRSSMSVMHRLIVPRCRERKTNKLFMKKMHSMRFDPLQAYIKLCAVP